MLVKDAIEILEEYEAVDDSLKWFMPGYTEAFKMAIKALESQQWIPCSERLPRQGQEVICQCRANMIKVLKLDAYGDWYEDRKHCYMSGFVIAWMPLPEPARLEDEYEADPKTN